MFFLQVNRNTPVLPDRVQIPYSLSNISFSVKPGQTIGIIGGTGSGKSTLVNLITRFYDASEGKVLVDGVDVKDYPRGALRRKTGVVPQTAALF